MPPSITQSQPLLIIGATLAFLVAALLVLYMLRLLFGRRVKAPGARNRPRRLDVVDAFDLDRDRQLVIIRRDNTEHLLMIGGPNDVVVEASINRIESRDAKPPTIREKEPAAPTAGWPAPPGPVSQRAGSVEFPLGPGQPPLGPAPGPAPAPAPSPPLAAEPARRKPFEPAPAGLQPLPPDLFAPATPKPAAAPAPQPPSAAPSAAAPHPPLRAGRGSPAGLGQGGFGLPPPRAPLPPFLARAQKGMPAPAEPPKGSARLTPPSPPPPAPTPAPPTPQEAAPTPVEAPTPPSPETVDLEAEMARLLGRPDQGT